MNEFSDLPGCGVIIWKRRMEKPADMISLLDVIYSLAGQVPTPEGCEDGILKGAEVPITSFRDRHGNIHRSEAIQQLKVNLLNDLFLSAARQSEAAAALDCYISNASEEALQWFDWGQTGWPKISAAARNDGLKMLVHLAGYFGRLKRAYQSGQFDNWPQSPGIQSNEGQFKNPIDSQRLREIGFKCTELAYFLTANGIPHSLANASTTSDTDPKTDFDTIVSAPINLPALHKQCDAVTDISTSVEQISKPAHVGRVHRVNSRRHALADLIELAQRKAGHSNNEVIVFPILIEMADSGMYPILKGFEAGKGIKYVSANNFRYFTKNALRKYLRPETRGRLKIISRQ